MADRIKGITVVIGGDTTGLSKALSGVNKQVSTTQSSLRNVERLLKMDPGNAVLLEQKQRLLNETLDATRKKFEELKRAEEQVKKQFESGEIAREQYDAFNQTLEESRIRMERAADAAEKFSASGEKMAAAAGEVKEKADGISKAFAPATKAIGALGAAAIAAVPATEDLRADLSKLDQNAREAAVGIGVARDAFRDLYVVTGEEDSSVEAVSNLLQAGFTESNLQAAVEGLAGAVTRFPDTLKVESLADSLQESLATDNATGQFAELLDRLGVGAENFSDGLAAAGTEAEKQSLVLSTLAHEGLTDTYNAWVDNNEALVKGREANIKFKETLANLAEQVQPLITKITELASVFLTWFNDLGDGEQGVVIAMAGIIAAISPLASMVSSISSILPAFTGLLGGVNIKLLGISAAIIAIVSLGAALANVWDDMSGMQKAVSVLGLLSAAALTAAIAVGAFQSALTIGLAVAGIVAGIIAVTAAVKSATNEAKSAVSSMNSTSRSGGMNIPGFADGGVVRPNDPFLAMLGDNKREPEVVAPYSTIKKAAADGYYEIAGRTGAQRYTGSTRPVNMTMDGVTFARLAMPYMLDELSRRGLRIAEG